MNQRYDVLGFGLAILGFSILAGLHFIGPGWAKAEDWAAWGSWAQAIFSAAAIAGTYFVATKTITAQRLDKSEEDKRRARGIARITVPELIWLRGELKGMRNKTVDHPPILPPRALIDRVSQLYLLGETGEHILNLIGALNTIAENTLSVQAAAKRENIEKLMAYKQANAVWAQFMVLNEKNISNLDIMIERLTHEYL